VTAACPWRDWLRGELLEPSPLHPHPDSTYGLQPLPRRSAPASHPSLRTYPHSKYKYLKINKPLVRATENISSIKVNVKGIHTRSKGHEIENNHMPSSRGPFVRVAFTPPALSRAQPSQ